MSKRTSTSILMAVVLGLVASPFTAAAPTPRDITQLKSLERRVMGVVEEVLPATISVFSTQNGASGSGVIINGDGLILTAGHVVLGAAEMTVIFPDGKQANGKVLGANYTRDAAMIQITDPKPAAGWPHASIADANALEIGDLVIAIGHAGGFDPVRTPPVRFGRVIAHGPDQFLTSDCALIGGDSGGPLFNLDGQVVGIHSSIGKPLTSNNHAGITGFLMDWEKLKQGQTWGRLGGSSLLNNPDAPVMGIIAGMPTGPGVRIETVIAGGPASKAGLRPGDVIHSMNHKSVPNLQVLHILLTRYQPGDTIKLRLTRGQNQLLRDLRLGRRGDLMPGENG